MVAKYNAMGLIVTLLGMKRIDLSVNVTDETRLTL